MGFGDLKESYSGELPLWVVVKIRVPVWVLIVIRHLVFRVPKRDHNFDNHSYESFRKLGGTLGFLERVTVRVR